MSSSIDVTTCATCGKEESGDINLKSCVACKLVKYCNRDCQIAHRPQHKKACKKRAAELYDEALFKDPPPREDCPICFLPLPIAADKQSFKSCCGKIICLGCIHAMAMEDIKKGKKKEEIDMCPFCRTLRPSSDEEGIERLKRQMEKGNADAIYNFAVYYARGTNGMPQDWVKANELYLKAGEFGCSMAYHNLGNSYAIGRGVEVDNEKAKHYIELAAMMGYVRARHYLGCVEEGAGNHQRAYKHFIISARAGDNESLDKVKQGFRSGYVTKDEFESTLRAYHEIQTEMKSDMRADSIAFREWTGSR